MQVGVDVVHMVVFWVMTPWVFINWSRRFDEIWYLRLPADWIRFRCILTWSWWGNWWIRESWKECGQLKLYKQIQVNLLLNQWKLNIRSLTARTNGEKWEPEQSVCYPSFKHSVPVGSEHSIFHFRGSDQLRSLQCWYTTHPPPAHSLFNDLVTSKKEAMRFMLLPNLLMIIYGQISQQSQISANRH
jgi:hypothetical protein